MTSQVKYLKTWADVHGEHTLKIAHGLVSLLTESGVNNFSNPIGPWLMIILLEMQMNGLK